MRHRKVYLKDDAWLKSTDLRVLVYSGMNVQVNVHHPDGAHKGLLYSVKYQLKPEPCTTIKGVSEQDHSIEKHFQGTFVSASQAAAVFHDERIFRTDKMPINIYPGWDASNQGIQGLWRRYLRRLTHVGELRTIEGYDRPIELSALHLSFLLAPAMKFIRYFQEDRMDEKEKKAWMERFYGDNVHRSIHEVYGAERKSEFDEADTRRRPDKLDRNTLDTVEDDYLHPSYEPVFSELPPGERFVLHDGPEGDYVNADVWKRSQNRNLNFPHFPYYDLLYDKK